MYSIGVFFLVGVVGFLEVEFGRSYWFAAWQARYFAKVLRCFLGDSRVTEESFS
jgi:hypothetical protein